MKPKIVFFSLLALAALAVASAFFLAHETVDKGVPPGAVIYHVRGEVRSVNAGESTIRIAHEEIPGYMSAMVMPFPVKTKSVLKGLASGDKVIFDLVVTDSDSWVSRIAREPSAPAAAARAATGPTQSELDMQRVQKGEKMPDFVLTDQNGQPIKLSDFAGKAVLVTFIYTRCPLPNFCPLMSKNFADLQDRLSKKLPGQYQMISITMDPEFDQPSVLKEYASRYDATDPAWRFGTGTPEQISEIAAALGLHYQWENGLISHDLRTALIGPDGRLVHLWKSNVWTPYEVERMTVELMTQKIAVK